MRLPGRLLALTRVRRRLGRGTLAAVVALALAATALGMAAGSSDPSAKHPSRSAAPAQAADANPIVAAIDALRGMAKGRERQPRRGGAEYYRSTARKHVPPKDVAKFLPLYREAQRVYGVNWRLIASVHRQETAFSTAATTYHGLNAFGCCAGPMQFNVTNGPPSTWELYRQAYRAGNRPKRYPHRTRSHPSVYDDFDAIMAAGSLLKDSGAGSSLDAGAWSAAYSYYGHDLFGITYASQVLARAEAWQRDGFCPNCPLDEGLVAEFEDAYGASARRQLMADERRRKKDKLDRDRKRDRRDRRGRRDRRDDRSDRRARRRPRTPSANEERRANPSPPRPRRRRTGPPEPSPAPPPEPSPTSPSTPPQQPPAGECDPIRKLLGC